MSEVTTTYGYSDIVSTEAIVFISISLLLTFVLPIVAVIVFSLRNKRSFPFVLMGALGFYVSQNIIRLSILSILSTIQPVIDFAQTSTEIYYFILAFSAALFETAARIIVLNMLKNRLTYIGGFGAGLGHGAIESVTVVGTTYINNIILALSINFGLIADQQLVNAMTSVEPTLFIAAGIERLLVIVIQIALMLLIFYGMTKGKTIIFAVICLAVHTVFDYSVIMINYITQNIWLTELIAAIFAAVAVAFIIFVKKQYSGNNDIPMSEAEKAVRDGF